MTPDSSASDTAWLDLLDWRRQVGALYARVRELREHDPVAAHGLWQAERNRLFRDHA